MRNEKTMLRWLYFLRILVIINTFIFIFFIFTSFRYWGEYFIVNASFIMSYIWFNYSRLFVGKMSNNKIGLSKSSYSVMIPCFNEEPGLLRESVKSILSTDKIKKEIIIVDDGSTNNIWKTIKDLKEENPEIKIFKLKKNKGKRYAQEVAINNSKYDFIISLDSDTIVDKNAIRYLLYPFKDKKVGATTGNVLIKNESKNILTNIQAGLYWIGLNVYKRGQSTQGNVVCCSGCLSAYRRSDLLNVQKEYMNQTFLGNSCSASEDRYLTNLMNEKGRKVLYVEESICYTEAPTNLKKFMKQQLRWKRGFLRESLYTTTYTWEKNKMLYTENLLWMLLTPVIALPMVLTTIYLIFFFPIVFITNTLPLLLLFIISRDSLFFIEQPIRAVKYLPYVFIYLFIMYPMNIYALFNSNPERWGTR